jgi:hypothetical protein
MSYTEGCREDTTSTLFRWLAIVFACIPTQSQHLPITAMQFI